MNVIKEVLSAIWVPAVRRAAAEAGLVVASAVVAAITAYFDGKTTIDPTTLLVARVALAWAERVLFQAKAQLFPA